MYIDESPFNIHIFRTHSWAPRGHTPNTVVSPRGTNVTIILAMKSLNIVHCEAVTSSVNRDVFKEFMNQVITTLGNTEKFTFVMDNLNFHHIENLIDGTIHDIRFLPPFSPFLNPCQGVFSQLKSYVRRDTAPLGTDDLIERLRNACVHVTFEHLTNYIGHAESPFEDCLLLKDINRQLCFSYLLILKYYFVSNRFFIFICTVSMMSWVN
ncbi:hypothetical protein RF11_10747 [Thelohanellus kitauei]|uniref:Tc1-like transposase DDE domain-containing protein n=1 Tax=Thelohanellus kitauei TaxID=669202 RepID=A0A0C2MMV0_THEKT|nr:hypothetical protein RF11_10747 [Thelohanellus kitauei]